MLEEKVNTLENSKILGVEIWFQEWNQEGNKTSFCGEEIFSTEEEMHEWLGAYSPNFEGCYLEWGFGE